MSVQQILSQALSQGALEKTLDALKTIFESANDKSHVQDIVLLTSRYSQIKREEQRGVLSGEEVRREKNRIAATLVEMIAEVPETAVLPADFARVSLSDTSSSKGSTTTEKKSAATKIPLFIGIGALLAGIALIVLLPCPHGMQFFVIRILMALGVGACAYYLTGSLDLKLTEGVKAGGALAVLAMIYLLNPTGGLVGGDCDPEKAVTVFVHGEKGCNDLILQAQGEVLMRLESTGETKKEAISDKGEAKFSGLRIGQKVWLEIDFSEPYRAVNPDSLYTISKAGSICLEIALQNQDKVYGQVMYKDQPLPGVIVSIGSPLRDTTDDLGYYEINIPKAQWKKQQEVSFSKSGFKTLTKTAFPQTKEPLNLLMAK